MDWLKSYSSKWRVFRVNRKTWADAENIPSVISAEIVKTADGNIIESGSFEITGDFESDYYRIVMTAEQSGDVERVDVATLLFNSTGGQYDYGTTTYEVDGASVLYPAAVTTITAGEYAPAGVNGAEYAADLLKNVINAPVTAEGSFTLNDNVVHELGSSVIEAVWAVLNAGNFVIQIDGRGQVFIRPKPTEPALVVDNSQKDLLQNGITFTSDVSEIPNRYIVIDEENITIAENNDPASIVSYVTRGYHVDVVDTSPTPVNSETYSVYAERRLKEESVLKEEKEYAREYVPDVYPYSVIRATIDGLDGDMRVQSQNISCGNGITVTEKVVKETVLYD